MVSVIAVEHSSKRVLPTWQSSKSSYAVVTTTHPGFLDSTHLPLILPLLLIFLSSSIISRPPTFFHSSMTVPPLLSGQIHKGGHSPRLKRGDSERNGPTEYTRNTKQRSSERRSFSLCLPPLEAYSVFLPSFFFFLKGICMC